MTWDPAYWPLIRTAIIALLAFIVVSIIAWPATKAAWADLKKRGEPPPSRPPARPTRMPPLARPTVVQGYEIVFNLLRFVALQKDALERALSELDDDQPAQRRRLDRRLAETLDTFSGLRDAAAGFLAKLSDQEIGVIAVFMSQSPEYCDGLVSEQECLDFLVGERRILSGQPYLAVSHMDRLNKSGPGKLFEDRAAAAGPDQPPPVA